jgi:two-component sensor histidine kinase
MFTSFKNRFQKLIWTIIVLLGCFVCNAQPTFLDAEMEVNTGMLTNQIRVIQKDNLKRIWVGTEHGLQILSNTDTSLKKLINKIGDNPIWALAFSKQFAFIGTRYNGVYIYNINTDKIDSYFDSSIVGFSRQFRVINDTVFLSTKNNPVYFFYKNNKWNYKVIHTTIPDGHITDFAKWNNKIIASFYTSVNKKERIALAKKLDSEIPELHFTDVSIIDKNVLSLYSNDSLLLIGGINFYSVIKKNNVVTHQSLIYPNSNRMYPAWDAVIANNKPVFSIGSTDNLEEGKIITDTTELFKNLNPNFYGHCMLYDEQQNSLWVGTLNRGLFYWPFFTNSFHYSVNNTEQNQVLPISKDSILLYNKQKVILYCLNNNSKKLLYQTANNNNTHRYIFNIAYHANKLYVIEDNFIVIKNILSNKQEKIITNEIYNSSLSDNRYIYFFSSFRNNILRLEIETNKKERINAPTIQTTQTQLSNNKILYHSSYTGFHILDKETNKVNTILNNLPDISSYALCTDTLWALVSNKISVYKIDTINFTFLALFEYSFKQKLPLFSPLWIVKLDGNLLCGNYKGFFKLNTKTAEPEKYIYLGHYTKGETPVFKHNTIFFNTHNYITRLSTELACNNSFKHKISASISTKNKIFQWSAFSVHFSSDNYISALHSLKHVELWQNGKLINTFYTLKDKIEFSNGLEAGNYTFKIYSDTFFIKEFDLNITLPLILNPFFYFIVTIFVILFGFILFKYFLNKRTYEKEILANRLQMLKQNLNPHFIFNSLNLIYSLVLQKKNDVAITTINNFSNLHRYYLANINQSKIQLSEELKFIESYIKLESSRVEIDDKFEFSIIKNIKEEHLNLVVPPMILQPLVENAIKYSTCDNEVRKIWIDIHVIKNSLVIGVENTLGDAYIKVEPGNGVGISLVQERLLIFNKFYTSNIKFILQKKPSFSSKGYRCELIFPIITIK